MTDLEYNNLWIIDQDTGARIAPLILGTAIYYERPRTRLRLVLRDDESFPLRVLMAGGVTDYTPEECELIQSLSADLRACIVGLSLIGMAGEERLSPNEVRRAVVNERSECLRITRSRYNEQEE